MLTRNNAGLVNALERIFNGDQAKVRHWIASVDSTERAITDQAMITRDDQAAADAAPVTPPESPATDAAPVTPPETAAQPVAPEIAVDDTVIAAITESVMSNAAMLDRVSAAVLTAIQQSIADTVAAQLAPIEARAVALDARITQLARSDRERVDAAVADLPRRATAPVITYRPRGGEITPEVAGGVDLAGKADEQLRKREERRAAAANPTK